MVPWNPARTKVQIKLSIQRLRTLQEKKLALAKKSRRDIADLIAKSRIETAKLRVEGMIQDDIYVELLEVLELYAETLQARFGLLDQDNISDAVCAIIYAAPRTELKELHQLREILMHKYGRTFSLTLQPQTPPPEAVPKRVQSKLAVFTPSSELVDAYLSEIARGYGVPYNPLVDSEVAAASEEGGSKGEETPNIEGDDDAKEGSPASCEKPEPPRKTSSPPSAPSGRGQPTVVKKRTEVDELAARFERLKNIR
ncbi:hypothetical protein A1Q2_03208 [Trichosporon asahii var. asahii CBS 8904]|uniref:DUF292-domain-containing protein n=1 Tax=Trichosporon asahii var. asahii (strain CBS 8904) TaxID=1220162 RepID=K1W056_TRIAC|nr:hypothetical protein A1Q2_03208 [Trichosporon asahii var. asahii CBS 8904]